MKFSHKDYSVAWICALPVELAAAKAMLDETHSSLPQTSTDHNVYTLGRLNNHAVVVACLPYGVYGTTSAANVLADMRSTFPSLRFGLMVGVGGGVPNPSLADDIRRGDVVVSKPTANSPSIIQYDYGKTVRNGKVERTGSLNKPAAMAELESNTIVMGKNPIMQIVRDVLEKNHEMRETCSRPDNDDLFLASYPHDADSSDVSCLSCDRSQLVNRIPRDSNEPHIHYGVIASGNQVIKDAPTRDRLAKELGGILCFEMEAAGLMDRLPCLVIRGICDYCDSHKDKAWQGYAALTAAAYARALLSVVPMHASTNEERDTIWMVPFPRNMKFVGRQDEITKIEALLSIPYGPRKVAITGLGGVGKTQVALELAYRRRGTCSVFWISSVSQETVQQGYMSIAERLKLEDVSQTNVKERVKSYLSHENAGKWLLVCDNVDDMDMWVSKDGTALESFLPQSDQGRIIYTTRNREVAQRLAPSHTIPIAEMDSHTATQILTNSLPPELFHDPTITTELLRQLAFLPLAIAQAAAYISDNGITLSDYLSLLEEQEEDIVELLSKDFGDDGRYAEIQNPVATTWLVSFQQIQRLNPLAAEYLSFMACINPRNIPKSLPPAPSLIKQVEALGLLHAYSFISTQGDGSVNLHRLVHLATRNWMRQNDLLHTWTCRAIVQFDKLFPDEDDADRPLRRTYLPHALFIINSTDFNYNKEKLMPLLNIVGKCYFEDTRFRDAELLFQDIMDMQKKRRGEAHLSTILSAHWLVLTYMAQRQWTKAAELGVKTPELAPKVLGTEDKFDLQSLHALLAIQSMYTLLSVYCSPNPPKEAEKLGIRVLEMSKKAFGTNHQNTLSCMSILAKLYRKQKRLKEAEDLAMLAFKAGERNLGTQHPITLFSMRDLASIYRSQGRLKKAEELYERGLKISQNLLGVRHPQTLTSMLDLALTYNDQDRLEEGEKLAVEAMKLSKTALGVESQLTRDLKLFVFYTYKCLGKHTEAEELMRGCETRHGMRVLEEWQAEDTNSFEKS